MWGLFADDSQPFITWPMVFMAVVTGLPTAAGSAWGAIVIYRGWVKQRRTDMITELTAIIDRNKKESDERDDRQQKQLDRYGAQIDEQQKVINRLVEENADCRAEGAEMYTIVVLYHGIIRRWQPWVEKAGAPPETIPDLPPKPRRGHPEMDQFQQNTTQFNTNMVLAPPQTPEKS